MRKKYSAGNWDKKRDEKIKREKERVSKLSPEELKKEIEHRDWESVRAMSEFCCGE